MDVVSAPGGEDGDATPRADRGGGLTERARYEREVAALDLSDAEQAGFRSVPDTELATELYHSADRHRLLAQRLEEGDASAVPDAELIRPEPPDKR